MSNFKYSHLVKFIENIKISNVPGLLFCCSVNFIFFYCFFPKHNHFVLHQQSPPVPLHSVAQMPNMVCHHNYR